MLLYITNGEGETENDTFCIKRLVAKYVHAMGRTTWAGIFSILIFIFILFINQVAGRD